jgi:hypothetical protein
MPDLFANQRLRKPAKFLKYAKLQPINKSEITDHYVKYVEPVFEFKQETAEKFWCFDLKTYEFTEDKIKELKEFNIRISPSDYEWVIDIFEKTTINDQQCGIVFLIQ